MTTARKPVGRLQFILPACWAAATIGALIVTLSSLRTEDFDGLNNILQLPLALPWVLLPYGIFTTHIQDAWIAAVQGLINAVLLYVVLRRTAAKRNR